ncbi:MAG TPA: hypothetical protein VFA80_19750 [Xanthobacteraceae bacterium]|jgi:hypothetical protein|nr:hypothetical protein [Xanthobacteraceae bacterium]
MAATIGRLAAGPESRVGEADSFLSIIEQNAPQFLLKSERRRKKIIYLKFPRTRTLEHAIAPDSAAIAGFVSPTSSRRRFAVRGGKKTFTIPRESARRCCTGAPARRIAALRRARPLVFV